MRRLALLLLFAFPLAAQTPYVPTCLSAQQQADIVTATGLLTPKLGIDLTDPLIRLADEQCTQVALTTAALANIQTLNQQIATLQAQVAALQKQVAALTPSPVAPSPITPILQLAADKGTSSIALSTASTSDSGSLDGQKVILSAGQVLTYNLAANGTYSPFARLCNAQGSTSSMTAHFEITPGVMVGSELTLPTGQQWTNLSSSAGLTLTGNVTLRLVIDSVATNGGSFADVVGLQ